MSEYKLVKPFCVKRIAHLIADGGVLFVLRKGVSDGFLFPDSFGYTSEGLTVTGRYILNDPSINTKTVRFGVREGKRGLEVLHVSD